MGLGGSFSSLAYLVCRLRSNCSVWPCHLRQDQVVQMRLRFVARRGSVKSGWQVAFVSIPRA